MSEDISEYVIEPITEEAAKAIMPEDLMCEDFTCILRASDCGRDKEKPPVVECP